MRSVVMLNVQRRLFLRVMNSFLMFFKAPRIQKKKTRMDANKREYLFCVPAAHYNRKKHLLLFAFIRVDVQGYTNSAGAWMRKRFYLRSFAFSFSPQLFIFQ